MKRRCRSLTTDYGCSESGLQLGRRRLGQKNRVDEKVFVDSSQQLSEGLGDQINPQIIHENMHHVQ